MIALLLVAVCLMAAILIGGGWLVPRHVAEQAAIERLRESRRGLAAKQCSHTSVPWPVMTSNGTLVAWLCEECMEQRDTFTSPPPKRMLHDHEWSEVRTLDGHTLRSDCLICGVQQIQMSEEFFRAGWTTVGVEKPSTGMVRPW